METFRCELNSDEFDKLNEIIGKYKNIILCAGTSNVINHRKVPSEGFRKLLDPIKLPESCIVNLEPLLIKTENSEKLLYAKVCPCGTLFISTDIQEVH